MELFIVPVAHVSASSSSAVREAILREKPDLVAVELDALRLRALQEGRAPSIADIARSPFTALMYYIQQEIGRRLAVKPGSEMLAAISAAQEIGAPVLLADVPISATLAKIGRAPFAEKLSLVADFAIALLLAPLQKRRISLNAITPDFVEQFLGQFKERYPHMYRALISDRDAHIARQLLRHADKRIVLVVGAGHAPGVRKAVDILSTQRK